MAFRLGRLLLAPLPVFGLLCCAYTPGIVLPFCHALLGLVTRHQFILTGICSALLAFVFVFSSFGALFAVVIFDHLVCKNIV